MIVIDGNNWDVPCSIERISEIRPSDISGLMLDKTYFNDVIGTFLKYSVVMAVPTTLAETYDTLYETLTNPVDGHSFVMPYGQDTISITARVESVTDTYVYVTAQRQYWRGVKFEAIANHPTKTMSLEEVTSYGRAILPEVIRVPVGTLYEATASGWEERDFEDADEGYY